MSISSIFNGPRSQYLDLKQSQRVLPNIIATGYAASEAAVIDALREMSVDAFLVKSIALKVLLTAVDRLMENPNGKVGE